MPGQFAGHFTVGITPGGAARYHGSQARLGAGSSSRCRTAFPFGAHCLWPGGGPRACCDQCAVYLGLLCGAAAGAAGMAATPLMKPPLSWCDADTGVMLTLTAAACVVSLHGSRVGVWSRPNTFHVCAAIVLYCHFMYDDPSVGLSLVCHAWPAAAASGGVDAQAATQGFGWAATWFRGGLHAWAVPAHICFRLVVILRPSVRSGRLTAV